MLKADAHVDVAKVEHIKFHFDIHTRTHTMKRRITPTLITATPPANDAVRKPKRRKMTAAERKKYFTTPKVPKSMKKKPRKMTAAERKKYFIPVKVPRRSKKKKACVPTKAQIMKHCSCKKEFKKGTRKKKPTSTKKLLQSMVKKTKGKKLGVDSIKSHMRRIDAIAAKYLSPSELKQVNEKIKKEFK